MSNNSMALYDLLKPDFKHAAIIGWKDAETEAELQKIRQSLEEEIDDLEWDSVKTELYKQLDKLLNISLGSVLARAWVTSHQVKEVIKKTN